MNELKLGERIGDGDDNDGATLCGNCQYHFKGDGSLELCNVCFEDNKFLNFKLSVQANTRQAIKELQAEERLQIAEGDPQKLLLYFSKCDNCKKGYSNIGVYGGGEYYSCSSCHIEDVVTSAIAFSNEEDFLACEVSEESSTPHYDYLLDKQEHIRVGRQFDYDGWSCDWFLKDGTAISCKDAFKLAERDHKIVGFVEYEEDEPKVNWYNDTKCPSYLYGESCSYV